MKQDEHTNALPQMNGDVPPKFMMKFFMGEDIPIDGGWGYSKDDAVIITTDNSFEGVQLEYEFAEQRAQLDVMELDELYPDKNHYFESYRPLLQSLKEIDGVPYDVIEAEVTVSDDDDNETTYRTECWFNIAQFFGKY